jgi:arsenate reductase
LTDKEVDFRGINYLEEPLSPNAFRQLLRRAGLRAQDSIRTNEDAYRKFVAEHNLNEEQLIRVMAEHPELLQRPIVVRGDQAVLARPVERLADLDIE